MRRLAIFSWLWLTGCSAGDVADPAVTPMQGPETLATPARDYARHVARLRGRLPHAGFHIVVQEPFVVIGDEPKAVVERRARSTVKWAVDLLKKDYFGKDPRDILDIWLFKDRASYLKHTMQLFHERPSTPYGYYSSEHKVLVMNIKTGGGTLVHEIVHPFIESNFADCPSWFNEGLASLYEQSGEKDGKIVGHTNWRLRGLQQAIEARSLPDFETLLSTSTHQFYSGEHSATNYAQARYLCYYLQEQGTLRRFYRDFVAAGQKDRTGVETLRRVLGAEDLKAFQKDWEAWVLRLRFG